MVWLGVGLVVLGSLLCALAVTGLLFMSSPLRHRSGEVRARLRPGGLARFHRGRAAWLGDVFIFRGSHWRRVLVSVHKLTPRKPTVEEARRLRGLGSHPFLVTISTDQGTLDVACEGARARDLAGPFVSDLLKAKS